MPGIVRVGPPGIGPHQRRLVAAVPQGAGATVRLVDVLHAAPAQRSHQPGDTLGFRRRQQEVHVVGHLDVRVQCAAGGFARLAQPFAVGEVIFLSEEAGVAVMSPLNDVQGKTWGINAGATGHVVEDSRFCQLNRAWPLLTSFNFFQPVQHDDRLAMCARAELQSPLLRAGSTPLVCEAK